LPGRFRGSSLLLIDFFEVSDFVREQTCLPFRLDLLASDNLEAIEPGLLSLESVPVQLPHIEFFSLRCEWNHTLVRFCLLISFFFSFDHFLDPFLDSFLLRFFISFELLPGLLGEHHITLFFGGCEVANELLAIGQTVLGLDLLDFLAPGFSHFDELGVVLRPRLPLADLFLFDFHQVFRTFVDRKGRSRIVRLATLHALEVLLTLFLNRRLPSILHLLLPLLLLLSHKLGLLIQSLGLPLDSRHRFVFEHARVDIINDRLGLAHLLI